MIKLLLALAGTTIALPAAPATTCTFSAVGAVAFGQYDAMSSAGRDTQANVAVRCDRDGGPGTVTIVMGLGPGANGTSTAARKLVAAGSSAALAYGLFQDSGRSVNWGNTSGSDTASRLLTVQNKSFAITTFIVYGRIPPGQDVPLGTYSDTIQVTLTP